MARAKRWFWAIPLMAVWVGATSAAPYQLTAGDTLEISYVGKPEPVRARIDLDGEVRIAGVGGISVAGLSLDDTEDALENAMVDAGQFLDPEVSVWLYDYAPVIVSGDVAGPGRFEYLPGMTVAAALGLSGGSQVTGISRYEVERARAGNDSDLRQLNLAIAGAVARIARLEASLTDDDAGVAPSDAQLARIPAPLAVDMDQMIANEAEVLANARAVRDELIGFWDAELKIIEEQRILFGQRIEVQQAFLASVEADLANAQALQERGLQTVARVSSAEQRAAEAKTSVLELESAMSAAARSVGLAQRARAQFLSNAREEALLGLRDAQIELAELQLRYGEAVEQQGILSGGSMRAVLDSAAVAVQFTIVSARMDRELPPEGVTQDTPLLPGDTLFVSVTVVGGADAE